MTSPFHEQVLGEFYLSEQVDLLHLALTNLIEMLNAGEIDLILDQANKKPTQKKAFLEKVVSAMESPGLRSALMLKLTEDDLEFFRERNLRTTLTALQHEAEKIVIVKLNVAVSFKEKDLREMVAQLSEQLKAPVALDISVEHSLIGGAIVQFGTAIRDYSIKTRLEQFRDHWKKAVVEA